MSAHDPFAPAVAVTDEDAGAAAATDDVPDGTITDVMGWVDDDPDRAGRALYVEEQADKPRTRLIARLEEVLTAP